MILSCLYCSETGEELLICSVMENVWDPNALSRPSIFEVETDRAQAADVLQKYHLQAPSDPLSNQGDAFGRALQTGTLGKFMNTASTVLTRAIPGATAWERRQGGITLCWHQPKLCGGVAAPTAQKPTQGANPQHPRASLTAA